MRDDHKARHDSVTARLVLVAMLMLMTSVTWADDHWPQDGWRVIPTQQNYTTLLDHLKSAVEANDMGVVTDVGPTQAAAQRGVEIPGNRVVGVFRNDFAVDILRLSVPAMIEAPIRFYITENEDGTATLAWKLPSVIFAPYIARIDDPGRAESLAGIANKLDTIFADIAEQATAPTS
ncbi:DUF302 domain-containing protein [Chromohalobacter nigrandesensis]|uniref:DUF302 domain-containing protein n=1 Tax=Chromohalobacter nigrandesensis TaxID=119863 RepID=UPI001FF32683|nr:DUF302 domain-containing protein [Chromohalobacter nigrandesensis]MCK0745999.1 DUF302 domain-containing protein [Chromohalobacter nigrandesensis]